jgi:CheY-like chemotaxis protein
MALVLCTGIDPALMATRQLILERAGHQVLSASTEKELEKACREHRFDVAVLGEMMPLKVKPRVFRLIREHCASAAILELYPHYGQQILPEADAALTMPTEHPQEFADAVNALANGERRNKKSQSGA